MADSTAAVAPPADPSTAAPAGDPAALVESLLRSHLRAQMDSRFDPREIRLSEAGGCPRFRAAKAAGGVPAEALAPDEWDAGYFARGRVAERLFADLVRSAFPRHWRREVPVRHPWGTGHLDFWYPAGRFFVELKTATASVDGTWPELPRRAHLLQVQAYLHFFRGPDGARRASAAVLLYLLLGQRLEWRAFPVRYAPRIGEQIEAEMREIADHAAAGTLPPVPAGYSPFAYPCAWRARSGSGGRCPLFDRCWGPEAPPRADGADPVAVVAGESEKVVREYAALHAQKAEAEREAEALSELMRDMRPLLDAAFAASGAKRIGTADGVTVVRSEAAGRRTVDWDAALAAGAVREDAIAPFVRQSPPTVRYLVRPGRASDGRAPTAPEAGVLTVRQS